MKKLLLTLLSVAMMASCMQAHKLKPITMPKSIAVPSAAATGAGFGKPFAEALKYELRKTGWKIIVSGVTGRGGENASINSGANYTLLGGEENGSVSYCIVENRTGEEVFTIYGKAPTSAAAKSIVKKLNAP